MKEITDGNRGAISSLKGYRTQALYSICRILEDQNQELKYIPEGIEDLDILNESETLQECIQVKSTTGTLSFSDLIQTNSKTSFFHRAVQTFENGNNPKLKLVCFGNISEGLIKLFAPETDFKGFEQKFKNFDFSPDQLKYLQSNTSFETASEEDYQHRTIDLIKAKAVAIDADHAIEYLHYWLFFLSEKGGEITQEILFAKLNDIGKFVAEREKYHTHLHSSIRKIETRIQQDNAVDQLSNGFFEGVGATYDHISAGLDVKREEKLYEVAQFFKTKDAVIVHGASGQGKSALAYRFIKDYSALAYEVILLDRLQATLEQIQALNAISKSLEIPILIYIDVIPGNQNWLQILKDFASGSNFKFLITIREEDWNRTPEKEAAFSFGDVELRLTEEEAKSIYQRLNSRLDDHNFTDFDEVWLRFGGHGPLLEFTYLINQGKTLKSRIESQLNRIEDENPEFIQLLKIVSFSDNNAARVKVDKIRKAKISTKLRLAVEFLKGEYLLQFSENEFWLLGLHPIRSALISELLHIGDTDLEATCIQSLKLVEEADLFVLLTNVFRNISISRPTIMKALNDHQWNDYVAYRGICKALIWLGIKTFTEDHEQLIEGLYKDDSELLALKIYLNFSETVESIKFLKEDENWNEKYQVKKQLFKGHGVSKSAIFSIATAWLKVVEIEVKSVEGDQALEAMGEFLFWISYLLPDKTIPLNEKEIKFGIQHLSIHASSRALFGLHCYSDESKAIALSCEEVFLERLHKKYEIGLIEREDGWIKAHFILDIFNDFEDEGNIPHLRKLEIIDALRYGLPYLNNHGAKGYGHKLHFVSTDHDDSNAQISTENNPIEYLVSLNNTLQNLFTYERRPVDWTEFVDQVLSMRKKAISRLEPFLNVLEEYFRKGRKQAVFVQYASELVNVELALEFKILFPQSISDSLGLVAEGSDQNAKKKVLTEGNAHSLLNKKFKAYRDDHNEYFTSLNNFLWQSAKVIFYQLHLALGKKRDVVRISLVNIMEAHKQLALFQRSFGNYFGKYVDPVELKNVEEKEEHILRSIAFGWKHVVHPMPMPLKKGVIKESSIYLKKLKNDFERRIKRDCDKKAEESGHLIEIEAHFEAEYKRLILVADLVDVIDQFNGVAICLQLLKDAIGTCQYLSLKHLMLDLNYNEFWIIPSCLGQVYHKRTYRFKLHQFTLGNIEKLQSHAFFPQEIDEEIIEKVGLFIQPDLSGKVAFVEFMTKWYQELTVAVGVAAQLHELASLDGHSAIEEEIVKKQIQNAIDKANNAFSKLTGNLGEQLNYFEGKTEFDELEQEYFQLLREVAEAVLPTPNEEGKEIFSVSLNYDEILSWRNKLEQASERLGLIYLINLKLISK
ncbi:MAG: hypothetical protein R8N23_10650 [Reichenbachiella sp.]|uniref:hypothetical protein n=1 Tax=Reichenbachiella sp. TaxID=2184521 RepID=UPI0029670A6A|nr:hypothetical protein [Reichenbachiella sp.]MDW3210318.1 hypothetical protein [Reichenbachiella sp.]